MHPRYNLLVTINDDKIQSVLFDATPLEINSAPRSMKKNIVDISRAIVICLADYISKHMRPLKVYLDRIRAGNYV